MAKTGRLFDNGITIHQIHFLCGCNKHKRVQRYAMTRRKTTSGKYRLEISGSSRFRHDRDSIILLEQIRTIDKRRLREYMGTLDKRFLPAMDKALAISIGLNGYSQCPMKQGRLSASLPAHECCPLHDDSVQKKD